MRPLPDPLRKALPVALPILVLVGGAVAFAGLSSLQPSRREATVQERAAPRVRVAPLAPRDVTLDVIGHGNARERDRVQLGAEVGGRVAYVASSLRVGSFVDAGEVLVRLDDREARIARQQAAAELARTQAEVERLRASRPHLAHEVELRREAAELSKAELDRQLELETSGVATRTLLERARSTWVQDQTQLRVAQRALDLLPHDLARAEALAETAAAALAQADYTLERLVLRSPIPAQVRVEDVDLGQVVAPGTPLVGLAGHAAYEVAVQLTHDDLIKLARIPGQALPVGIRPPPGFSGESPATVTWVARPEASWEAQLTRIESVDADTRTIPAVVEVRQPWASLERGGLPLLPGAYCRVRLQGQTRRGAWVVPEQALREGDRIFVRRQGKLAIVPVAVDHLLEGEVVILPGLPLLPGDAVITSPLTYAVEGMTLDLEGPAPEAAE